MKTLFVSTDISDKLTQVLDNPHSLNAKIVAQMHAGVAHFFYYKKGKKPTDPMVVREAYGTLKKEFLERLLGPQDDENQPSEPVPNSDVITQKYWDVEAGGFRAFNVSNLIAMF